MPQRVRSASMESESPPRVADPNRSIVDSIEWSSVVPSLQMLSACRLAFSPSRLVLGLLAVVLVYVLGTAMDAAWGPADADTAGGGGYLIFETLVQREVSAFKHTIGSALRLEIGVPVLLQPGSWEGSGVLGGLTAMVFGIPLWLVTTHPGFAAVFTLVALLVTVTLGGAISRSMAMQVGRHRRIGAGESIGYVTRRMVWYLATALIPPGVVVVLALLASVVGLLFNAPLLDVVGGLLYGLVLILSIGAAVVVIGMAAAGNLMMPALAVEGTDAFDAVSRAFAYVYGRPLHFLWYTAVVLVAGALTYAFLGLAVWLTLWLARTSAGLWVFRGDEAQWYDAVVPPPQGGQIMVPIAWDEMSESSRLTATLIRQWQMLMLAILPAYAFCYYFCAYTWVYLLIRRSADGAPISEVYEGEGSASQDVGDAVPEPSAGPS
ncbi:MAG: hypothetical protein AAGK09_08455 [Planctomycetota bacterium]